MKSVFLIFIIFTSQVFASQEDSYEKLRKLDWKKIPASYTIGEKASITTSEDEFLVIGKDANDYMLLMQGHNNFKIDAAVLRVRGSSENSQVIYTIHKVGFLTKDDWADNIDKDRMLKEIQSNTVAQNKNRGVSFPNLYVDGWAQAPHLDNKNNTVYWAITGHDEYKNTFINAKALKLGREGYTEILWIGSKDQFTSSEIALKPVLANYSYKEGFTYADYIPGTDAIAAAGVGALVYKLATGKAIAKAGLVALALLFAKKFWFFIFLPLIYLWKFIKRKLNRSEI